MPSSKAYFQASLKIIGVLTIIWSLTQVTPVIAEFYSIYNQPDLMPANDISYFRFSLLFQVFYPILLFIIGSYLLKSGDVIVQLAFRHLNEENKDKVSVIFILFMKLVGLILIIYSLPTAFQLISNIIFYSFATTVYLGEQMIHILPQLAKVVVHLLLGLYLLRSGKIFYKIGFSNQEEKK